MQEWTVPENAELLADVQLGSCAASTVAWCPVNGLLAVGARQHAKLACVHLISPHCAENKVTLAVPLQGTDDDLLCVRWSPAGCRRVLLTATKCGAVSAWTQLPSRSSQQADMQSSSVFTLGDWWCHSVGQLTQAQPTPTAPGQQQQQPQQEYLLSMQWLQPPPCWPYSNRVLQEQDFQAGSVPNMFAPAAPRRRPSSSVSVAEQSGSNFDDPGANMHWVEPGTLAFAAVLSSGKAFVGWATWSVLGHLGWQLFPSIPLLPSAASPAVQQLVLAAEAAWSPSGIVVAFAAAYQPDVVQVVELQGNPLHHQCLSAALRSQRPVLKGRALAACSIPAAAGAAHSVLSVSWDPNSDGQRMVVATCSTAGSGAAGGRGPGQITLLSLAEQQQQQQQQQPGSNVPPVYVLAPVNAVSVPEASGPQQFAWLLDGLLVGQQLLDTQTLTPLPVSFSQPTAATGITGHQQLHASRELRAVASSPHRVAVAMVWANSSGSVDNGSSRKASSSLLLYSVPPVSKAKAGGAVAPTLAGRLVWSLLLQPHSWDLVAHVLHAAQPYPAAAASTLGPASAAAAAELQARQVAHVLGLVDRKLGVQADEMFSMYATRWDVLKYAVVCRTPGSEARAFSIDLRLRLLGPVLDQHLTAAAREEEARSSGPAASAASTGSTAPGSTEQASSSAIAALADYAISVLEFEIACINTWIHRRITAAAAAASGDGAAVAAAEASVKAVPCIRFCLDFKSNAKLAATGCKAAELAKQSMSRVYVLWKLLHRPSDGNSETPANWEDWLLDVVPGPFELHPLTQPRQYPSCIVNLRLPAEQLLRHMQCPPDWQQVPVLTDADITTRATRLGLLPATTLVAKANYAQQVQAHSLFRQQLPRAPLADLTALPAPAAELAQATGAAGKRSAAASLAAAKRRRWERQLRDAMGSTTGGAAVGSDEVIDLVGMTFASPTVLALQSVDGAVMARELVPDGSEGRAVRRAAANMANTWAYACPITGEMWFMGAG